MSRNNAVNKRKIYSITSFSQCEYVFDGVMCLAMVLWWPSSEASEFTQKLMPLNLRTRKSISGARGTRIPLME